MFSLQVLGAVVRTERALIAERTKSGLKAARARGRVGGNLGVRLGDREVVRRLRASRDAAHLKGVLAQPDAWLPTVRRYAAQPALRRRRARPDRGPDATWTTERLRCTVRRLINEGIVEATLLGRAKPQQSDERLVRLVAGIKAAAPERTLADRHAACGVAWANAHGGTRWHPSSVRHLLLRAEQLSLTGTPLRASRRWFGGKRPAP